MTLIKNLGRHTNQAWVDEFIRIITKRFEMSMMGELKFFLGFQIKQLKDGTFISQTKYINDILKKFDMNNAKPIKTPMPSNGHLDLNEEGKSIDQKVYHSMIGSLLYLCASRLDIMLIVCMCARFQANPKECHLMAVLTVNSCIKVRLYLQADKSPIVVNRPFFPRVVNPRYRIHGTNV
jgi:hypothetical protein